MEDKINKFQNIIMTMEDQINKDNIERKKNKQRVDHS